MYTNRTPGVPLALQTLPAFFHFQQTLHDLQVVAEDQQVVPAVAVLSKGPRRLQRYGQRVGQNVLLAFLAGFIRTWKKSCNSSRIV
jgi:hypothetical protein